jgi:hypothetical protein
MFIEISLQEILSRNTCIWYCWEIRYLL